MEYDQQFRVENWSGGLQYVVFPAVLLSLGRLYRVADLLMIQSTMMMPVVSPATLKIVKVEATDLGQQGQQCCK